MVSVEVYASCEWIGAKYGQYISCPSETIATGACGSGRTADWSDSDYMIL